jgi:hypothetical protein
MRLRRNECHGVISTRVRRASGSDIMTMEGHVQRFQTPVDNLGMRRNDTRCDSYRPFEHQYTSVLHPIISPWSLVISPWSLVLGPWLALVGLFASPQLDRT